MSDLAEAVRETLDITPAIKHDHEFCAMPVFPVNVDHAWLYLAAGVIL